MRNKIIIHSMFNVIRMSTSASQPAEDDDDLAFTPPLKPTESSGGAPAAPNEPLQLPDGLDSFCGLLLDQQEFLSAA